MIDVLARRLLTANRLYRNHREAQGLDGIIGEHGLRGTNSYRIRQQKGRENTMKTLSEHKEDS
jgi:hypothetical protein